MSELLLSPNEARVLAALVEKSKTTPQYYPMTVNALMMAANQKNARSPVMSLNEGEVGAALTRLEAEHLVQRDDRAGRVPKWRHRFQHQLLLKAETLAVLVALMLRGAQTPAELRANAIALGGPADAAAIDNALADLADRAQPLVTKLPRAPGQAADRWMHRLCGEPEADADQAEAMMRPARAAGPAITAPSPDLEARIRRLEDRVAELERQLPAN